MNKLLVLAIVLAAASSCNRQPRSQNSSAERADSKECAGANVNDPLLGEQLERDRQLFNRAGKGEAEPATEAAIALKKKDFRFFAYLKVVPGIHPAAYGAECRPDLSIQHDPGYFRGIFARSDMPSPTEAVGTERLFEHHYSAFAAAYNRAIIRDASYPWRDLCRIVDQQHQSRSDYIPVSERYGYRDLQETASPIDLGEAARRGTLESLTLLVTARRDEINRVDPFGLTPLAWAIVYHRKEYAETLMKYGADPSGSPCQGLSAQTSPIQLARALRWREMIDAMRPHMTNASLTALRDPPKLRWKVGTYELNRRIELARTEHYADKLSGGVLIARISVDASGNPIGCNLNPGSGSDPFDRTVCSHALLVTKWFAAKDEYGEPVAGEGSIRILMPKVNTQDTKYQ